MKKLLLFLLAGRLAAATCCAYIVKDASDSQLMFTEVIESDFSGDKKLGPDMGWIPQEFNVSASDGRGKFGKAFRIDNVVTPKDDKNEDGGGLVLKVGSEIVADAVTGAEIDTSRLDMHWGSFRAGMKVTGTGGTCAAFFWYFNDTQEIDMEFLSHEFDQERKLFPINLVIQTEQSMNAGYDATHTGTYQRVNLQFDPTDGIHEYRFDYLPGKVFFYADGQHIADMEGPNMPSSGGHLILQHWSNGNSKWSGGPPQEDAELVVGYVHAYFNSSTSEGENVCVKNGDKVCSIGQYGKETKFPDDTKLPSPPKGDIPDKPQEADHKEDEGEGMEGMAASRPQVTSVWWVIMMMVFVKMTTGRMMQGLY